METVEVVVLEDAEQVVAHLAIVHVEQVVHQNVLLVLDALDVLDVVLVVLLIVLDVLEDVVPHVNLHVQ